MSKETKWCPDCATHVPVERFTKNRSQRDGLGAYCKPCMNQRHKRYQRSVDPAVRAAYQRTHKIKKTYGLTVEQYEHIMAVNVLCAICQRPMVREDRCLDHCHDTGRVRGVLCHNCNRGLRQFRDDPSLLMAAAKYLL